MRAEQGILYEHGPVRNRGRKRDHILNTRDLNHFIKNNFIQGEIDRDLFLTGWP